MAVRPRLRVLTLAPRCLVVVGLPWLWPCRSARARSGGRGWDASAHLLLSVVASPSDIRVPDPLAFWGAFLRVGLVEPMPQDRGDRAVARRADVVAAVDGCCLHGAWGRGATRASACKCRWGIGSETQSPHLARASDA